MILDFLNSDNYLLILSVVVCFLLLGFLILIVSYIKLNRRYKKFMRKLSKNKNIEEDLKEFLDKVSDVEEENEEIRKYCKDIKIEMSKCIQKVGIVRYNAFKDTGSDLSFTVALLDEKDDGVVFNGIYSREMSNIYAKPIEKGTSHYTLSEEEQEAIKKATKYDGI